VLSYIHKEFGHFIVQFLCPKRLHTSIYGQFSVCVFTTKMHRVSNLEKGASSSSAGQSVNFLTPVNSNTSLSTGVERLDISSNQAFVYNQAPPSKKRKGEEPRKPALEQGANTELYKSCRTAMVKRIRWSAYKDQVTQYKTLKFMPVYCQLNKPIPQIWQSDPDFSNWWDQKISLLQEELFNKICTSAETKVDSFSKLEREAIIKLGEKLPGNQLEEAKGALCTLEKRLIATEADLRRKAFARDIHGGEAPNSKNNKRQRRSRSKGRQQPNRQRSKTPRPQAGTKRKANNLSESDTRLAEIIAESLRAAKRK
jgi:hypothetical protein